MKLMACNLIATEYLKISWKTFLAHSSQPLPGLFPPSQLIVRHQEQEDEEEEDWQDANDGESQSEEEEKVKEEVIEEESKTMKFGCKHYKRACMKKCE